MFESYRGGFNVGRVSEAMISRVCLCGCLCRGHRDTLLRVMSFFSFCQELMFNIQAISRKHLLSLSLHCIVGVCFLFFFISDGIIM